MEAMGSDLFPDLIFKSALIRRKRGQIYFSKEQGTGIKD